jgi:hypothetical protein
MVRLHRVSGGSLLGARRENFRPLPFEPRVSRPRHTTTPQQVHGLLKYDRPNSVFPRELEGPNMQKIGDSLQSRRGLIERLPHSAGELHFIEPRVEAAQIGWLVIAHEAQIPV